MTHKQVADAAAVLDFTPGSTTSSRSLRSHAAARWFLVAEAACDGTAAFLSAALIQIVLTPHAAGSPLSARINPLLLNPFIYAVLFVLTLYALKGYSVFSSLLQIRETERTMKAATLAMLLDLWCLLSIHQTASMRSCLLTMVLCSSLVTAERQLLGARLKVLHERMVGSLRVMIYGNTVTGRRVYDLLSRSPRLGLKPSAMIDAKMPAPARLYASAYRHTQSIQVLPGPLNRELLERHGADMILIDPEVCSGAEVDLVRKAAGETGASVAFLPSKHSEHLGQAHYIDCDGVLLALPIDQPLSLFYEVAKRLFDLVVGSTVLVLLSPVFLIATVAIRLESEGPALFVQTRMGKQGKPFSIFKLRTMYTKMCGDALSPKKQGDPRITRVGQVLRKTSLDELPQLFNVLRGEMSLVGPRPEMKMIVETYTPAQRKRLAVVPGITGLWQLSADRAFQIHDRIEYDLYYIEHRNMFLDLAVMLHTLIFAVRGI
jgi:exopolysaccharide biosynthesis polyprenyl glycosylphosphotransferase